LTPAGRGQSGCQNGTNDLASQCRGFRPQADLCCFFIFLKGTPGIFHLSLGTCTRLGYGSRAHLESLLTTHLFGFEYRCPSLAQALLVLRRAGLGRSNVGLGLFDRALSFATPLGQHSGQGPVDQDGIDHVKRNHEKNRGHGPKQ